MEKRTMERQYLLPLAAAYGASVLKVFEDINDGAPLTELETEIRKIDLREEQSMLWNS